MILVKPVYCGDYDAEKCGSKAGTNAGRFETDSRRSIFAHLQTNSENDDIPHIGR